MRAENIFLSLSVYTSIFSRLAYRDLHNSPYIMYTLDNFISFINSLIFIYAILLESRRLRRYWSKIQRLNSPGYRDQKCCDELCRRTIFARPEMITNGIALLWGKRWRYNIAICRPARRWNIAERAILSTFLWLRGAARSIDYRRPNFFAI